VTRPIREPKQQTMRKASTTLADIGWLLALWLMVPLAIVAIGLPFVLIVRLIIEVAERM